jgi:hypothetical protein
MGSPGAADVAVEEAGTKGLLTLLQKACRPTGTPTSTTTTAERPDPRLNDRHEPRFLAQLVRKEPTWMERAHATDLTDGASWRTRIVTTEDDAAEGSGRY